MKTATRLKIVALLLREGISDFDSVGYALQGAFSKAMATRSGFLAEGKMELAERMQDIIDHVQDAKATFHVLKKEMGEMEYAPREKVFRPYLTERAPETTM